jgi:hypothetical protein
MPFDDAGFPDDGPTPATPQEALWLRYAIAVLLTLAVAAIPAWSLWRISRHTLWSF